MTIAFTSNSSAQTKDQRIRVMIADDAIVMRGLVVRWMEEESDLDLVAAVRTGREAVVQLDRADPDVVVLDIEMPELDGITALPLLLEKKRDLIVIMASTMTRRNARISLEALSLGAADYILKPGNKGELIAAADFRRDLIDKIRQLGVQSKRLVNLRGVSPFLYEITSSPPLQPHDTAAHEAVPLRPMPLLLPQVLLIGSSTGGPQALNRIVSEIGEVVERVPVLLTQHMPPTFTTILAEHLSHLAKYPVREAVDGEGIHPGAIYMAPGGKHMSVKLCDGEAVAVISNGPPINFCRPAVDPLFSSAAEIWGNRTLALVLTGMGSDGLSGARAIVARGGHVLAQDEETSVIWGMPGQVAHAGLCSALLPLNEIGSSLNRLFVGERP